MEGICLSLGILLVLSEIGDAGALTEGSHPIDTNHVILISDLTGGSPSYFGFSTILISSQTGSGTGWILVSAPRGSSREVYQDVEEPGLVWRCSLGSQMVGQDVCSVLPIDPIDTRMRKLVCSGNRCRNEKRDESWSGMTMAVNSERLVVCVPKWKRGFQKDQYRLNGLCYWLPMELILSDMHSLRTFDYAVQRLAPLLNQSFQVVDRLPVWSVAQAGFSAHLTQENELLLGAPGVNGWNGSVIRYQDNWTSGSGTLQRLNRKNDTEFSQYSVLETNLPQLFYDMEYFGYAVTEGHYFDVSDEADVSERMVGGSCPRGSSLLGLVLLFEYPDTDTDLWLPFQTVQGDAFGSYFGYALLSLDVNGDGLDELFVAAPFRSSQSQERGQKPQDVDESKESGDQGCVFVYSAKQKLVQFGDPEILCGSQWKGARFGSAMVSLGDINADGFKDVAIAAPYDADSEGVVYIFHGRASLGINQGSPHSYALKVTPKILRMTGKVQGFGASLFGSVDIDGNGTPDLAIGSWLSQTVVVLRTQTSVSFETRLEALVNGEVVEKIGMELDQFLLRSCTRISQIKQPFLSQQILDISVRVQLDPGVGRLDILNGLGSLTKGSILSGNHTLEYRDRLSATEVVCAEWNLGILPVLKENMKNEDWDQFRILHEVRYEEEVHRTQSLTTYHLGQGPDMKLGGADFESFCSACPSPTTVVTELNLLRALDNCEEDGDPKCKTDLRVDVTFHYGDSAESIVEFILGSPDDLVIVLSLSNSELAETAYFPLVELKWNHSSIFPQDESVCHLDSVDGVTLQCRLGERLQRNETKSLRQKMKTSDLFAERRRSPINFSALAFPAKDQTAERVAQSMVLTLKADAERTIMGSSQNSTFSNDKYTKITQTFKIGVQGQSPVDHIRMSFWFPIRSMKEEAQLIFLTQPQGSICRVASEKGHFWLWEGDGLVKERIGRRIRAPQAVDKQKPVNFKDVGSESRGIFKKHLVHHLGCDHSQDPHCLRVDCHTRRVERNSFIEITFGIYVYNQLIKRLMLQGGRPILHFQTIGSVKVLEDDSVKLGVADTFLHDDSIEPEEPIGVWVYIVSGIMGLLILAILICLLIRCGFFQRALKRKWDSLKSHKGVVMEEPELWGRWEYSTVYQPRT